MKKRILSLLAALALCLAMAGCTISTPDSVGRIGQVEISSGMYLLVQYQAYYEAQAFASEEQQGLSVRDFLKETITVTDEATGESSDWLASDYVADRVLTNLQYYAAVRTRFAELGGALTEAEIAAADSTAQQIWDANSELYAKNGFGLATIREYEYTLTMADDLLQLVYGPQGESPVSDETLTRHVQEEMVYGFYASVPLYDTSTYALDEETSAQAREICQEAVDAYNALVAETPELDASGIYTNFYLVLMTYLPNAYSACGNTFDSSQSFLNSGFFTESVLESYYSQDAADVIRSTALGQAVLVDASSYGCELFVRADPLSSSTLDDVRDTALQDLMGEALQEDLYAAGAALENSLDAAAMKKLPAGRIVLSLS